MPHYYDNSLILKLHFRVYCKFHYLEGHESTHSEEEIWKFLVKISKNEDTKTQYSGDDQDTEFDYDSEL